MEKPFPFDTRPPPAVDEEGRRMDVDQVLSLVASLPYTEKSAVLESIEKGRGALGFLALMSSSRGFVGYGEEAYRVSRACLNRMRDEGDLWNLEMDRLNKQGRWVERYGHGVKTSPEPLPSKDELMEPIAEWLSSNSLAEHEGGANLATFVSESFIRTVLGHGQALAPELVREWVEPVAYYSAIQFGRALYRNDQAGEAAHQAGQVGILQAIKDGKGVDFSKRKLTSEEEIVRRMAARGLTDEAREVIETLRYRDMVYLDPGLDGDRIVERAARMVGDTGRVPRDAPLGRMATSPSITNAHLDELAAMLPYSGDLLGSGLTVLERDDEFREKVGEPDVPGGTLDLGRVRHLVESRRSVSLDLIRQMTGRNLIDVEIGRRILANERSGAVRAELAKIRDVRQDHEVRAELLKSRSVAVAGSLAEDGLPGEFRQHFNTIASNSVFAAGNLLKKGIPEGAVLEPEDLIPLLESRTSWVRSVAVLALGEIQGDSLSSEAEGPSRSSRSI